MQVTTSGLDLAKNVFQVHGIDEHGEIEFTRALRRTQMLAFLNA
jgi:transposase